MARRNTLAGTAIGLMLVVGVGLTILVGPTTRYTDLIIGTGDALPDIGTAVTPAGSIHTLQVILKSYADGGELVIPWATTTPTWDPDHSGSIIAFPVAGGQYKLAVWDEDDATWKLSDPTQ